MTHILEKLCNVFHKLQLGKPIIEFEVNANQCFMIGTHVKIANDPGEWYIVQYYPLSDTYDLVPKYITNAYKVKSQTSGKMLTSLGQDIIVSQELIDNAFSSLVYMCMCSVGVQFSYDLKELVDKFMNQAGSPDILNIIFHHLGVNTTFKVDGSSALQVAKSIDMNELNKPPLIFQLDDTYYNVFDMMNIEDALLCQCIKYTNYNANPVYAFEMNVILNLLKSIKKGGKTNKKKLNRKQTKKLKIKGGSPLGKLLNKLGLVTTNRGHILSSARAMEYIGYTFAFVYVNGYTATRMLESSSSSYLIDAYRGRPGSTIIMTMNDRAVAGGAAAVGVALLIYAVYKYYSKKSSIFDDDDSTESIQDKVNSINENVRIVQSTALAALNPQTSTANAMNTMIATLDRIQSDSETLARMATEEREIQSELQDIALDKLNAKIAEYAKQQAQTALIIIGELQNHNVDRSAIIKERLESLVSMDKDLKILANDRTTSRGIKESTALQVASTTSLQPANKNRIVSSKAEKTMKKAISENAKVDNELRLLQQELMALEAERQSIDQMKNVVDKTSAMDAYNTKLSIAKKKHREAKIRARQVKDNLRMAQERAIGINMDNMEISVPTMSQPVIMPPSNMNLGINMQPLYVGSSEQLGQSLNEPDAVAIISVLIILALATVGVKFAKRVSNKAQKTRRVRQDEAVVDEDRHRQLEEDRQRQFEEDRQRQLEEESQRQLEEEERQRQIEENSMKQSEEETRRYLEKVKTVKARQLAATYKNYNKNTLKSPPPPYIARKPTMQPELTVKPTVKPTIPPSIYNYVHSTTNTE